MLKRVACVACYAFGSGGVVGVVENTFGSQLINAATMTTATLRIVFHGSGTKVTIGPRMVAKNVRVATSFLVSYISTTCFIAAV